MALNMQAGEKALRLLVETVEATGGLMRDHKGMLVPVADEDWLDLADAYVLACESIGTEPKIDEEATVEDEDDGESLESVADQANEEWGDDDE